MLIFIFMASLGRAEECPSLRAPQQPAVGLYEELQKNRVFQCVEQEFLDPLLDPWKVQSFVLKRCEEQNSCREFLQQKVSEMSGLDSKNFASYNAVGLWGKMHEYAGLMRKTPLTLRDLPLQEDAVSLYEKLNQENVAKRELNSIESLRVTCSALAMIVGPQKAKLVLRAPTLVQAAVKRQIAISHSAEKALANNRLPQQVKEKFLKWKERVEKEGIEEVRKTPGFHDKPLNGELRGTRSIRLNEEWRANYVIEKQGEKEIIRILEIHPHKY